MNTGGGRNFKIYAEVDNVKIGECDPLANEFKYRSIDYIQLFFFFCSFLTSLRLNHGNLFAKTFLKENRVWKLKVILLTFSLF